MSQDSKSIYSSPKDCLWERNITLILKGCHYAGTAIFVVIAVLTVVHAVGRYAFDSPILGQVEITSFMLLIGTSLTGAYTMAKKGHIEMGVIVDRLSKRTQAIVSSITYLLCLLFTGIGAWQAFVIGISKMQIGNVSQILHVPIYPFYFVVCIGWILFSLIIIIQIIDFVRKAVKS